MLLIILTQDSKIDATKEKLDTHLQSVSGLATKEYVNTVYFNAKDMAESKELELKRRVTVVEGKQDEIIKLLHEIKGAL